jgi:pimeloyl-ACP methyl ester carboxylesterase
MTGKLGSTPRFETDDGAAVSGSIAEIAFQRLGGVDQWVMIRGADDANPPLIHLHGGPGFSETALHRKFNAGLEQAFTVVYWDQRGAGKSYAKGIPQSSMTAKQFVSDLDDLVDAVRDRLGHDTVTLVGHSWGSAVGVLYAREFPDKVAAYVGSGQIGDAAAAEAASYSALIGEARRHAHGKAVRELLSIGAPPYDVDAALVERKWLTYFDGQSTVKAKWRQLRLALGGPESSLHDIRKQTRGFQSSIGTMWEEMSQLNLHHLAPSLEMPVFFFLGRQDRWVPPQTSVDYFDALDAPSKRLVWFEESGHQPFIDEATKFNHAMLQLVRPAVLG